MLHIGRSRSDVVQGQEYSFCLWKIRSITKFIPFYYWGRDKVVQLFTYYLKDIPHIQWHLRKFIKWYVWSKIIWLKFSSYQLYLPMILNVYRQTKKHIHVIVDQFVATDRWQVNASLLDTVSFFHSIQTFIATYVTLFYSVDLGQTAKKQRLRSKFSP